MTKLVGSLVVALLLVAAPAHAELFQLNSYTVSAHASSPGLAVYTNNLLGALPKQFQLNSVGASTTFALFQIGTNETGLGGGNLIPYGIGVNFQFGLPAPAFGGTATGITGAGWFFGNFGYVAWNNPFVLQFGTSGKLGISLQNATFGLPGKANINATFTLLQANGGPTTTVPEASSALLFGVGALAIGALRRRRAAIQ